MAVENIVVLTDDNFENEVLKSDKPVLIDFWATWCGPCKAIAPIIDEIAEENKDSIKVCKADIDECPQLVSTYRIMSVPTFIVFKNGEAVAMQIGSMGKAELLAMLN